MTASSASHELHHVQRPGTAVGRVRRPGSLSSAAVLLHQEPDARLIAGGTDLLLDLQRGGPGDPVTLIDLTSVAGFRQIVDAEDHIELAGGVTHAQVVSDPVLADVALPLVQACAEIGSPQLRNRATIAGNLATASPANDSISALMALDAIVELGRNPDGRLVKREVPVVDFFDGFRSTVMTDDEIITAIRIPKLRASQRGIWTKVGLRKAQAISVVHAGVVVDLDDAGVVAAARLAMGSVAPTVAVIDAFGAALVGRPLSDDVIAEAASVAAAAVRPIDDVRATAQYRTDVIEPVLRRALTALRDGQAVRPHSQPVLAGRITEPSDDGRERLISDDTEIEVEVNGTTVRADGAAGRTLLDWLRDKAAGWSELTGTKEGCAEGECGACTVIVDGAAVMSCLVSAAHADRSRVVTIEGLAETDQLSVLQGAFVDCFAVQCGFCIPGFVMAGSALLDEVDDPTDDQIDIALSGNLCRCTGYYPIRNAVRSAAGGVGGS